MTFHLSKPDPDFLFKLALPDYDAVPASTPLHARLPLPATGPYKIAGYQPKGVVVLVRNPRFRVWSAAAQPDGYPDRIVERFRYTGAVRDPRGRARDRRHHGGRPRSDLAARARGLPADALLEPALPRAAAHDPRALAEHEARAVQRRPRPAGVQPRGRPQPARPDQRRRGGMPVPAAERERLQLLLPLQRARTSRRPAGSSPSPAPRGSRSRSGSTTSRSGTGTAPTWSRSCEASATTLGSSTFRMTRANLTWRPDRQAGVQGWGADYPSANNIFLGFLCSSYTTNPATNRNPAGICDRHLDAQVARAQSLETTNPAAAAGAWHSSRPHADRRGAVGADEGLRSPPTSSPGGSATTGTAGCRGRRDDRRVPRPALGALSLVLASAV